VTLPLLKSVSPITPITQGVFETMRLFRGRVMFFERHLERLLKSCLVWGMRPPSKSRIKKAVFAVIEKNRFQEGRIRLSLLKTRSGVRLCVSIKKITEPRKKGFSLILLEDERMKASPLTSTKSLSRDFYERLFSDAKAKDYDEALFLNTSGEVVEGTRTNIFCVKGDAVITPELSSGCLGGITRSVVIEILKKAGVSVAERKVLPSELFKAQELFLTNALIGVMPVTRFNNVSLKRGQTTKKLIRHYQACLEKECGRKNKRC
jgi:branched-chain amino acid aminotransferase